MLHFGSDISHQSSTVLCNKVKENMIYTNISDLLASIYSFPYLKIFGTNIVMKYIFLAYRIHFQTKQVFVNLCENLHGEIFHIHMISHMNPVALILLIWFKFTPKNVPNNDKCGCTTRP